MPPDDPFYGADAQLVALVGDALTEILAAAERRAPGLSSWDVERDAVPCTARLAIGSFGTRRVMS